ncbi:DUF805 domain-containing protein [Microbulbifer variabilis]|uniref:DUF805 domain-containing protein n=1 Tax=Microbulbifer variabilis TaxID=266805 RepID=UPI00036F9659|nr:DUF805 domain-containing protein [Microbulbifer variabilis]
MEILGRSPIERVKLVTLDSPRSVSIKALLFSFDGRIARRQFLLAFLPISLMPTLLVDVSINAALSLFVVLLWPLLAVTAKRYHDIGKRGWWGLIQFWPVIGWIWILLECGTTIGDFKDNKYGKSIYRK